jgi:NDP-sugar pyrophosphorylase family protein
MKDPLIIIPMSGIGKRFLDSGYDTPKPLIEVDGYPIIEHVVNLFDRYGDIIFICNENHLNNTNMISILRNISPNCNIVSAPNENRRGPVDAINKIIDLIDDDREIIISYCDYGTVWNYKKFLIEKGDWDGFIPCYTGFHPHMLGNDNYAYCKLQDGLVSEVREKQPFGKNKMGEYTSNGTYYFKSGRILKKYFKELVDLNIEVNGEFYVSLVYNLLIRDGLKVGVFLIEKMLQWGTPYDLETYIGWSNYFKNKKNIFIPPSCPDNTTLILPMAGKGSRFSDVGYNLPKPMLPIDNNIMVVEAVNCLPTTDDKIFICLEEHTKNFNLEEILIKSFNKIKISKISKVTQGQAITCEIGLNEYNIDLNSPILISACDNGMLYDTTHIQEYLNDENIDVIVWSFRNNQSSKDNPDSYAWLKVDENHNIKHVSCKKFIYDNPLKTHAIIGTMFFRKSKFFIDGLKENVENNIKTNGEFYVDDVLNQNIKNGLNVKVFEVNNYLCWGTPNDYKIYNYWKEYFESKNYINKNVKI